MPDDDPRPGLSGDEARGIAERLASEAHSAPADPPSDLLAQRHELPPADEDRVEAALVDLGAARPETTTMAERDADAT